MKRILVIEDSETILMQEVAMLSKIASTVIDEALNGQQASEKLNQFSYDLIVCDWHLPDGSGLEILKNVRKFNLVDQTKQPIPFLMLTGNNEISNVKQAIAQGVSEYLVKPINEQILITKCCDLLKVSPPLS